MPLEELFCARVINRNVQVFTPTDFGAAITQHLPTKAHRWFALIGTAKSNFLLFHLSL